MNSTEYIDEASSFLNQMDSCNVRQLAMGICEHTHSLISQTPKVWKTDHPPRTPVAVRQTEGTTFGKPSDANYVVIGITGAIHCDNLWLIDLRSID